MDVSYLCLLAILIQLCGKASLFTMLTQPKKFTMNAQESQVLECSFDASFFNLFNNPVIWRKTQKDEVSQLAVLGKISEPFVHIGRFESSFSPSPPRYTFELALLDLSLEDSGNYTCEVYGENNEVLISVKHSVSVIAPVELTYITNGNETDFEDKPAMLHYTENQPGTLRCITKGGFPPPEMLVYIGDRDITSSMAVMHYTQLMGEKGLRLITTMVEISTHNFLPVAEDDAKEAKCFTTVEGKMSEIETVPLSVNYAPVIKCRPSRYYLNDLNVFIRCEVRARPSTKALFWVIDTNGTTVHDAAVVNGVYWSLVKLLGNGVLETKLFIHKATPSTFRTYTLVAENSVSMSTQDVRLVQKPRTKTSKPPTPEGVPQQPDPLRRSNGFKRSTAAWRHPQAAIIVLCTFSALWGMRR